MGSRAHATMLAAQKLITYEDLDAILKGIDEVRRELPPPRRRSPRCLVDFWWRLGRTLQSDTTGSGSPFFSAAR